jgi:membrane protease YdiL (CAAX protease family)
MSAALALAWAYLVLIISRHAIRPPRRTVPWTGWQLLVLVLLLQVLLPALVARGMQWSGTLDNLVGPNPDAAAASESPDRDAEYENPGPEKSLRLERESIWLIAALFPFDVAAIFGVLAILSGARLKDMGLTMQGLGWTLLLGFFGWMLLTPLVLLLNSTVTLLYPSFSELKEEEHPVMRMLRAEPGRLEILVIVFTAVVAAPVLEELLFRGVLQPWFGGGRNRGWIALAGALALAVKGRLTKMEAAWTGSGLLATLEEGTAIGFVLLLVPGYYLARRLGAALADFTIPPHDSSESFHALQPDEQILSSSGEMLAIPNSPLTELPSEHVQPSRRERAMNQAGAIYATSALFAAAHSFAWPTPISLFVLALGLGFLVYRTRSIVGSIVLHALFNAVPCVLLLLAPHAAKGNETTSPVPAVPPIAYSTTVPGS